MANAWEIAEKYQKICQWVMHEKLPKDIRKFCQWVLHEKLPKGIRKFVSGYCMKNCLKILEHLSMGLA